MSKLNMKSKKWKHKLAFFFFAFIPFCITTSFILISCSNNTKKDDDDTEKENDNADIDNDQEVLTVDNQTANELLLNLEDNQTLNLLLSEDLTISTLSFRSSLSNVINTNITIDLNQNTLNTVDATTLTYNENNITLKNGTINFNESWNNSKYADILVGSNATLTFENVIATFSSEGILIGNHNIENGGLNTKLTIKDSIFYSESYDLLTTNSTLSEDNSKQNADGIEVEIDNSTFTLNQEIGDSVIIKGVVDGNWKISNSTFNATRQGIMLMCGNMELNNVTINLDVVYDSDTDRTYPENWLSTGNEVSTGGIIVGNINSQKSLTDANLTFSNGNINVSSSLTTFNHTYFFGIAAVGLNSYNDVLYYTNATLSNVTFESSNINSAISDKYIPIENFGNENQVNLVVNNQTYTPNN